MNRLKAIRSIRAKLNEGGYSLGSWMQLPHPSVAEIMGQAGYDWVAVDIEHGAVSAHQLPDLFRALELGNTLPMARVAQGHPKDCKQALDAGAGGIIVPMIESAAQLIAVRDACRWPPAGTRGVGFSRANLFGKHFEAYREEAQAPLLVAMIEHHRAVADLDAILDVEGLDAILIGPYDLSASMGLTAQFDHPDFRVAMDKIRELTVAKSIPAGVHVVAPEPDQLQQRIEEGYRFLAYSIDAVMLNSVVKCPIAGSEVRTIVKEEEIRPQKIFDEYLRLAKADTLIYFSDVEKVVGSCPACGTVGEYAFDKHGFTYESCPNCQTLFVNPRPIAAAFSKYYTESPSFKYWASTFYKETAAARSEKLWKPKARMILESLAKHSASNHTLVDIGGGLGLFAEEIRASSNKTPVVIEPGPHLAAACRERSLPVVEKFLEDVLADDLPKGPKAFVSFELFEHLHDPADFLRQLWSLMASGDLFIFTTLSGTGVDIQALWEDSKSVSLPHHLNFLNPKSVDLLLTRLGFENLGVTTPGKLDLDILANNQSLIKDRFWRTFIGGVTDQEKQAWQEMIASSGCSSHMMVVCRKA